MRHRLFWASVAALIPVFGAVAQTDVPVVKLPPTNERTIIFIDRGRLYQVGLESGRSVGHDFVLPPAPNPGPGPNPGPIPPNPGPTPPGPGPTPPPDPAVNLQGRALDAYTKFKAAVKTDTVATAQLLAQAISATLGTAGGLNLDEQGIVNTLADYVDQQPGLRARLTGFLLDEVLLAGGQPNRDQLIVRLREIKLGLEAIR